MSRVSRPRRARSLLVAPIACLSLSAPALAADHFCDTEQEFIDALDNSNPGDTITLDAGTTFTAPLGGFILPEKSGSSYITIRSSNLSSLPPAGTRIGPGDAANMPNIRPTSAYTYDMWGIRTALPPDVSHHWKFIGIEFIGRADNAAQLWPLLEIGTSGSSQDTEQEIPHHFSIERCYFHDNSSTQDLHRPLTLHGAYVDILDCDFSGVKNRNQETQCIGGWNGSGPYNIINNYLEGAGENIMFGGSTGRVPNVTPSDILIQRNHFYKRNDWKIGHADYDGIAWHVKNHFELKCGRNVTIDSNIFDNCWNHAGQQYGASIVLKCIQTPSGGASWFTTENITITNNIIKNVGLGFVLAGSRDPTGAYSNGLPSNVTIRNNLVHDVTRTAAGNTGEMFRFGSGTPDVTIDHNTMFQSGSGSRIAEMWGGLMDDFVYTNNINIKTSYNFRSSYGDGEGTFDHFFVNGFVWSKNVIAGAASSSYLPNYDAGWNPTSLLTPAGDFSTVLEDYANPGTDYAGWKVQGWDQATNTTLYPYHNTGTDSEDVGCDIDAVVAATSGCISGVWSGGGGGGSNLIASEDVNYTSNLNGKTGGTGFGSNAWTSPGGSVNNPALTTGSLTYSVGGQTLVTSGNKIAPIANSQSYRNFASTIPTANTTKWVSFRAIYTGGGSPPSNHAGFSLYSGTGATGTGIFLGKPGFSATNWGVDHSGTLREASTTFEPDAFLVYKLVFTSSNVTISMWVNPDLSESSLGTSDMTPLSVSHSTQLASLRFSVGGNATGYQFDEFRIGDTFDDVAPTASQPTTVTLKNGVDGYTGATSFHVRGQAATTHYDSSRSYHQTNSLAGSNGYVERTFYKFDVSSSGSGIPSGSTITNATLRVKLEFRSHTYDYGIACYRMAPAGSFTVNYAAATRNTYNGTNNWTGGTNAAGEVSDTDNDYVDTPVDNNSTIPAVGQWIEFDVTSAVQAWVNGTANNGLLVKTNSGSSTISVRLSTPADSSGSTEYPELEVTYQ